MRRVCVISRSFSLAVVSFALSWLVLYQPAQAHGRWLFCINVTSMDDFCKDTSKLTHARFKLVSLLWMMKELEQSNPLVSQ